MTKADWLRYTNPNDLLYDRDVHIGPRKLRLFVAACCRRLLLLAYPIEREVRVLERYADGRAGAEELSKVITCGQVKYDEGLDNKSGVVHYHVCSALEAAAAPGTANAYAAVACAYAFAWEATGFRLQAQPLSALRGHRKEGEGCRGCPECRVYRVHARHDEEAEAAWRRERLYQCNLLRDLLGDPFEPVRFDSSWASADVQAIARHAYDERDFSALPILADALEEAGCTSEAILAHCRSQGVHSRGCWVLDSLLNKDVDQKDEGSLLAAS